MEGGAEGVGGCEGEARAIAAGLVGGGGAFEGEAVDDEGVGAAAGVRRRHQGCAVFGLSVSFGRWSLVLGFGFEVGGGVGVRLEGDAFWHLDQEGDGFADFG